VVSEDKLIKLSDQFVYAEFAWWKGIRRKAMWQISQIREVSEYNGQQSQRKISGKEATWLFLVGQDDESPELLEIPLDVVIRTLIGPPTGIDKPTN
jgi:hypothetical protein